MTGRLHNSTTFAAVVLVLLVALLLLGTLAATPARAATGAGGANPDDRAATGALPPQKSVGNIVETGQDITVPLGTSANSVFALGGSITIAGSVREVVAGIGADVKLLPTARVGTAAGSGDTSLVVVGGDLTSAPGATVFGKTTTEPLTSVRDAFTTGFWRPIASPLAGLSLIGWAGSTVLLVLLGLLVAAVLPRQTRASMRRVATHPASSLGWGALTAFVIVPLVTVALVITIVGILLAIPWALIVVPAVFAFGFIAMGTFIGDRLLRAVGYRGESLLLAATVGIVATQLVRLIPYAGAIIVAAIWIIGTGAAVAAFFAWRRSRKQLAAVPSEETGGEERKLRAAA